MASQSIPFFVRGYEITKWALILIILIDARFTDATAMTLLTPENYRE
jgi:hypothetical protein